MSIYGNKNVNKNFLFPPSHHIIKQNVQERREPNERPRRNGFHGKDAGPESISKTSSSERQSGIITTL